MTLLDNVSSTSIFPSGEIHPQRCLGMGGGMRMKTNEPCQLAFLTSLSHSIWAVASYWLLLTFRHTQKCAFPTSV